MRLLLSIGLIFALVAPTVALQNPPSSNAPSKTPLTQDDKSKPAQPNAAGQEGVVKIGVTLVQIDAIVTDKQGRQVADLSKDDFEVYEDGKRQLITNFSYFKTEAAEAPPLRPPPPAVKGGAPAPPVTLKPTQVRRSIALVVDDASEYMTPSAVVAIRDALRKFVDEQMQPGDLVAILRDGSGMGALQQFTADRRLLYAAIDRVRWKPLSYLGTFAPVETPIARGRQSTARNPDSLDQKDLRDEVKQQGQQTFTVGLLGSLNFIVRGMETLPGRKSVMLFSPGFDMRNMDSNRISGSLQRLIERSNRAAVSIYAIDPRGLVNPMFSAEENLSGDRWLPFEARDRVMQGRTQSLFYQQGALDYMARETGGLSFANTNDIPYAIRHALDDQKGYYLIGYVPEASTFKHAAGASMAFHKLGVRVKRAGLRVRTRSGFIGMTNDELRPAVASSMQQLVSAVTSPFTTGDIHLNLTSLFSSDAKQGPVVRSLLHIDLNDLTFSEPADGVRRANINVAAFTFGDNGNVIDQVIETYALQVREENIERARQTGLVYVLNLPVKRPGTYQLRTAIRDNASGHVGSANELIEVPDLKKRRLTLSGIILSDNEWLSGYGSAAIGGATAPEHRLSAASSPAVRKFRADSSLHYTTAVYNARLDEATHMPRLSLTVRLWRDGAMLFEIPAAPLNLSSQADWQEIIVAGSLKLTRAIKPGDYTLQLLVDDQLAKDKSHTATQWMDFHIVE